MNTNILLIIFLFSFYKLILSQSIICTDHSPKQYFHFPKLTKCNFDYNNNTKIKKYEIFKPNNIEFISNAFLCKKLVSEVSLYTDLSGYEHLVEKEINNKNINILECQEMIKNKYCEFGSLKKDEYSYHTNNKISTNYPNRFISLLKPKRYIKENCVLIETKIFSHYNQKNPTNVFVNMNKCDYLKGKCQIKSNEIMIWEVNKNQNCKFISIGIFSGIFDNNNKTWTNNEMQIVLNLLDEFHENHITDCDNNLQLTSEGYAIKSIREKRSLVNSFQEAAELQFLENNFEKNLKILMKNICQMFNDHNNILEILLKENPKKYFQKVLNYNAINVELLNDNIIEVIFCKEIDNNLIEFIEVNDYKGHIPIKINKYSDKIWYYKNNVITNKIIINKNITNNQLIKNLEINKNYDLNFVKNKVIIKEHIFNNFKTNIEEELINEIKQISNVGIELKEKDQNSMIPHEIIEEINSIFESYWIKFWRIYVTIAVTLFYIFIGRSLYFIISPIFTLNNFTEMKNKVKNYIPIKNNLDENKVVYRKNNNNIPIEIKMNKIDKINDLSNISIIESD